MPNKWKGGLKEAQKRYREKHREKRKQYNRMWYRKNKDKVRRMQQQYFLKNKDKIYSYNSNWQREAREKARHLVIKGYGGKCVCCKESILIFLEIHHPDGDGKIDRKRTGGNSLTLYNWLIRHNFPKGYELLCANCHKAKHRTKDKICPHQKKKV